MFNFLATDLHTMMGWQVPSIIVALCAVLSIVLMFTPQFLLTYRTNNTTGINKTMFTIAVLCNFCFAIAALFSLITDCLNTSTGSWHMKVIFSMFTCLNVYTFALNCYILKRKIANQEEAARMGLTEVEHFKQHLSK